MQNHFRVEVRSEKRASVISVSGELDLASGGELEEALARAAHSDVEQVIIDLRQLEFMDSSGLNILIKAHQRAEAAGQRFGLVKGAEQVQRLLSLTGVADRMTLVDAPEELLGGG